MSNILHTIAFQSAEMSSKFFGTQNPMPNPDAPKQQEPAKAESAPAAEAGTQPAKQPDTQRMKARAATGSAQGGSATMLTSGDPNAVNMASIPGSKPTLLGM